MADTKYEGFTDEEREAMKERARELKSAARRGKKIAVVALARRLAGILYALLRDGTTYAARTVPHRAARAAVPV